MTNWIQFRPANVIVAGLVSIILMVVTPGPGLAQSSATSESGSTMSGEPPPVDPCATVTSDPVPGAPAATGDPVPATPTPTSGEPEVVEATTVDPNSVPGSGLTGAWTSAGNATTDGNDPVPSGSDAPRDIKIAEPAGVDPASTISGNDRFPMNWSDGPSEETRDPGAGALPVVGSAFLPLGLPASTEEGPADAAAVPPPSKNPIQAPVTASLDPTRGASQAGGQVAQQAPDPTKLEPIALPSRTEIPLDSRILSPGPGELVYSGDPRTAPDGTLVWRAQVDERVLPEEYRGKVELWSMKYTSGGQLIGGYWFKNTDPEVRKGAGANLTMAVRGGNGDFGNLAEMVTDRKTGAALWEEGNPVQNPAVEQYARLANLTGGDVLFTNLRGTRGSEGYDDFLGAGTRRDVTSLAPLARQLDGVNADRYVLFGASRGGGEVLRAAEEMKGVAGIATVGAMVEVGKPYSNNEEDVNEVARAFASYTGASMEEAKAWAAERAEGLGRSTAARVSVASTPGLLDRGPGALPPSSVERLPEDRLAREYAARSPIEQANIDRLPRVPILLAWGENDFMVQPSTQDRYAQALRKRNPLVTTLPIAGGNHPLSSTGPRTPPGERDIAAKRDQALAEFIRSALQPKPRP